MQNPSHEHIQHNALKPLQIQTSRVGRRLVTIQDKCVRVVLASIVLLALCSLVVQPMPTYAADYTADTFAELETAITNANNTSSDDTITLSADIALTGALPTIANNGSLTIDGDGHSIDGAGANRIFSIGNDASVTIKHMMLLNGYHLFKGGAINKETGSSLTIVNSSFMGNSTDDLGGAIYSNGGSLTIVNSIFSGNTASGGFIISGAAIASYGDTTLTIVNSTFNGNSSDDNSSTIENSGAAMHLYNTIVVGTTSGVNCGGDSPDTNINNWFDDSFCDGINSGDPGFEDADGADDILGTADDDLRLQAGSSAIDAGDNASLPTDSADIDGDGNTGETLPIDRDGNTRVYNGVYGGTNTVDIGAYEYTTPCQSTVTVTSDADSGNGSLRQALWKLCDGGTITFDADYTITFDSPIIPDRNVTIDGSGHTVALDGGGSVRLFSLNDSSLEMTLESLTFQNAYRNMFGGALYNNGTLTINNSTFSNNTTDQFGGAIYSNGTLNVTNTTFDSNDAGNNGGAILNNGTMTAVNNTFIGNQASSNGGGVYQNTGATTTIVNNIFSGNSASSSGGAIYSSGVSWLTVHSTTLSNNSASSGGGIYTDTDSDFNLYNSIIVGSSGSNCASDTTSFLDTNITNWFDDTSCDGTDSGDPLFEDADGADRPRTTLEQERTIKINFTILFLGCLRARAGSAGSSVSDMFGSLQPGSCRNDTMLQGDNLCQVS